MRGVAFVSAWALWAGVTAPAAPAAAACAPSPSIRSASCALVTAPARALAAGGGLGTPRIGISSGGNLPMGQPGTMRREVAEYAALGAGFVRVDVAWSAVERRRGVYRWATYDRLMRVLRARRIPVLAIAIGAPAWARSRVCSGTYWCEPTEASAAAFGRFVAALARRYREVRAVEIWNEPNIPQFWGTSANPERYAQLVAAAHAHMKRARAAVPLFAGALAPAGAYGDPDCTGATGVALRGDGAMNGVHFLERMYAAGAAGWFDAVSTHPYSRSGFGYDVCSAWSQMHETPVSLRSLMVANGDARKLIHATEYGNDLEWGISEDEQRDRLREALERWERFPWAGTMAVYSLRDPGCCAGYHLVRPDWSRRPAWFAFREHVRRGADVTGFAPATPAAVPAPRPGGAQAAG